MSALNAWSQVLEVSYGLPYGDPYLQVYLFLISTIPAQMVSLKVFGAFAISSLPGNSLANYRLFALTTGRYGGAACSTCTTWLDGICGCWSFTRCLVPGAWHYFVLSPPADVEEISNPCGRVGGVRCWGFFKCVWGRIVSHLNSDRWGITTCCPKALIKLECGLGQIVESKQPNVPHGTVFT